MNTRYNNYMQPCEPAADIVIEAPACSDCPGEVTCINFLTYSSYTPLDLFLKNYKIHICTIINDISRLIRVLMY